jgi:hypothetical protein
MELIHELTYSCSLRPPMVIGGPFGNRIYYDLVDGKLEGPRIRGTWRSGGDWLVVGDDGFARLDVRAQFETDDGAFVFVQYHGVLEMNRTLRSALRDGRETRFEDQYYRITPRFETGDPRYAWLTQGVFVGEGRLIPDGGVEYRVFRVD